MALSFTKLNSQSFEKRAEKILDVFTSTRNQLFDLIADQVLYKNGVEAQLKSLEEEKIATEKAIQDNQKIISKIEEFLN